MDSGELALDASRCITISFSLRGGSQAPHEDWGKDWDGVVSLANYASLKYANYNNYMDCLKTPWTDVKTARYICSFDDSLGCYASCRNGLYRAQSDVDDGYLFQNPK